MDSINPVYARFVLRELLARGIGERELLAGTSLTREELETGGDISIDDFVTILDSGRRLSRDETLGLMIGRHADIAVMGPIGAAAVMAPTVREGLQTMESFSRLHATYVRVELISSLSGMSISFGFVEDLRGMERFHAESSVMLVQHYIETVTGKALVDGEYRFGFAEPEYSREYARCMTSPVSFGWAQNSVELPLHWLDIRSPYYNAGMWQQARAQLAQRIRELGASEEGAYTAHLSAFLNSHEPPLPDLGAAAAHLHLSERTLNRRLREEGTSFREIRVRLLNHWARQYLTETDLSVEAIAATLGYQDAANFRRAFRAWEDCSPREFRASGRIAPLEYGVH